MRRLVCLLALAFALRGDKAAEQKKPNAIASRFVPASIVAASAASPQELPLRMAVAKGSLDASGKSYVVAVYANSFDGCVQILAPRQHGSYRVAGEESRVGMAGDFAHVELKDVDGDGLNEIIASFDGLRGPYSVWILKWNGKRLINLTPMKEDEGVMSSALCDAVFEDLNGDGKLDLIGSNPYNHDDPAVTSPLSQASPVAASDPASIVAANYPDDLAADLANDGEDVPENRQQAFARMSTPNGDYIVAAYSNKARGAVVLLKSSGGTYAAVQEITDRIGEREPQVTAVDLDADGTTEAVVMFEYGLHPAIDSHIYRLAGGQLQLISPTKPNGASMIGFPHFLDLSGTGVLDLENDRLEGSQEKPVVVAEHYVLKDGRYVQAEPFDYSHTFYREEGQPVTATSKFVIPPSAVGKPFQMTIVNGGGSGADLRVSAATVMLNGALVAGPRNFSQQSSAFTVPVSLQQSNILAVTLDGKPAARVTIVVRHD